MEYNNESHDHIQKIGLEYFRTLLFTTPLVYHYTTKDRVESIKTQGLKINSKRTTETGDSRGIYFMKDDSGTVFADVDQEIELIPLVINIRPYIESVFIDYECYESMTDLERFKQQLYLPDFFGNGSDSTLLLMCGYVTEDIKLKDIFFSEL